MPGKATGYDGIAMANFTLMAHLLRRLQDRGLIPHSEVREMVEGSMRHIEQIPLKDRDAIAVATYAAFEQLLQVISDMPSKATQP